MKAFFGPFRIKTWSDGRNKFVPHLEVLDFRNTHEFTRRWWKCRGKAILFTWLKVDILFVLPFTKEG